jgi:hypothetical protein
VQPNARVQVAGIAVLLAQELARLFFVAHKRSDPEEKVR